MGTLKLTVSLPHEKRPFSPKGNFIFYSTHRFSVTFSVSFRKAYFFFWGAGFETKNTHNTSSDQKDGIPWLEIRTQTSQKQTNPRNRTRKNTKWWIGQHQNYCTLQNTNISHLGKFRKSSASKVLAGSGFMLGTLEKGNGRPNIFLKKHQN